MKTQRIKKTFKRIVKLLILILLCLLCWLYFKLGCAFGFSAWTQHINKESNSKEQIYRNYIRGNITIQGDIKSYNDLKAEYDTLTHPQEFLYYSIVMALEHDYTPAYYDAYHALTSIFTDNPTLGKIDGKTKEEAMYFLRLGAEKGDIRAQKEIERLTRCRE